MRKMHFMVKYQNFFTNLKFRYKLHIVRKILKKNTGTIFPCLFIIFNVYRISGELSVSDCV